MSLSTEQCDTPEPLVLRPITSENEATERHDVNVSSYVVECQSIKITICGKEQQYNCQFSQLRVD